MTFQVYSLFDISAKQKKIMFPELTVKQISVLNRYCLGVPVFAIARQDGLKSDSVNRMLLRIAAVYGVANIEQLKALWRDRVNFALLSVLVDSLA